MVSTQSPDVEFRMSVRFPGYQLVSARLIMLSVNRFYYLSVVYLMIVVRKLVSAFGAHSHEGTLLHRNSGSLYISTSI